MDINKNTELFCVVFFVMWIGSFILCYHFENSYMELAARCYTWFPLFYLTAISGTLFIGYLSQMLCRLLIMKPLLYIGKNTMYLLWVHIFDWYYHDVWQVTNNNFINAGARVAIDLVLFCILMLVMSGIKRIRLKRQL